MEQSKKSKTEREHYDDIKRDNALFADYYQRQALVSEEEWPLLTKSLGEVLPLTFRLTGHRAESASLQRKLAEELLPALGTAARELEWYRPRGHAFHLDTSRKNMRTAPEFASFHDWLVSATENGDVSRQEAVSMIPPLLLDIRRDHLVLDMCAAPGSKTAQLVEMMHLDAQTGDGAKEGDDDGRDQGRACSRGETNCDTGDRRERGDGCDGCKGSNSNTNDAIRNAPMSEPTGLVIANDADQQRAYMLYHQVKRILSPSLLVCNNDGTHFPTLIQRGPEGPERVLFDRILADVPCSGDGTLRKNATLWKSWTPNMALGLHPLQVRLLDRAVRLLRVGGRMVYSTCSMNFVENEAVVAHILNKYPHALQLLDVSTELKGLVVRPGRHHWKVITKEGEEYPSFDEVPLQLRKRLPASLFPQESYANLGLHHCLRIYPHLQNTGGFFVAVIVKRAPLEETKERSPVVADLSCEAQDEKTVEAQEKKTTPAYKRGIKPKFGVPVIKGEDQFRILDVASEPVLAEIFNWYGIDVEAMKRAGYGFLVRSERTPIKVISIVAPRSAPIFALTFSPHRAQDDQPGPLFNQSLKVVNAGVRAFELYQTNRPTPVDCLYRLLSESVSILRPFITRRILKVPAEVIISLLKSQDSLTLSSENTLPQGGAIFECITPGPDRHLLSIPVWISERGTKAFVPNPNRPALLLQLEGSAQQ